MAKISIAVSDTLQKMLSECAEIDRIAPIILQESAPLVVDALKKRLEPHSTAGKRKTGITYRRGGKPAVYSYVQTGELRESVKAEKAKREKGGWALRVGFGGGTGYDSKGVANDLKANQLEYGNSNQAPTPFLDAARNDCEKAVREKQQEVFLRETGIK